MTSSGARSIRGRRRSDGTIPPLSTGLTVCASAGLLLQPIKLQCGARCFELTARITGKTSIHTFVRVFGLVGPDSTTGWIWSSPMTGRSPYRSLCTKRFPDTEDDLSEARRDAYHADRRRRRTARTDRLRQMTVANRPGRGRHPDAVLFFRCGACWWCSACWSGARPDCA